jgi:exopolyphosphatase/pppGpp-phosphohydrolase
MGTGSQPFFERTSAPLAVIDVDTDRVQMLVARVNGGGLQPLVRAAAVTGLADGVDRTGLMDEGRVELTAATVAQMADEARQAGARALCVACTEPVRSVINADELLDRIAQLAGTLPRVLSELDEARLSFRGIVETTPDLPDEVMVVEPNLPSALLLGARDRRPWWSTTIPAGLATLSARWELTDPPAAEALHEIADEVEILTRSLAEQHPSDHAVACGPFVSALRRVADDRRLDAETGAALIDRLAAIPAHELCERAEMAPGRAVLLGVAAAVVEGVRRAYRLDAIDLVAAGVREGLLLEQAGAPR